jgi:hypothetical protein
MMVIDGKIWVSRNPVPKSLFSKKKIFVKKNKRTGCSAKLKSSTKK